MVDADDVIGFHSGGVHCMLCDEFFSGDDAGLCRRPDFDHTDYSPNRHPLNWLEVDPSEAEKHPNRFSNNNKPQFPRGNLLRSRTCHLNDNLILDGD
ncbi:hypothetical protein SAY86_026837 [Trapa natans]|uniref:Uncharacterized protein n=1 Tax=Trapa natans TaxID=22666 RepID=A0AAN7KGF4_TRANT|nr:hypothetical protein SAY86_026837 [Trapa natans]